MIWGALIYGNENDIEILFITDKVPKILFFK
jgi:hypothetical protein